jgi:hypothetical protein
MVVGRQAVTKASVLAQLVAASKKKPVIYLADEFAAPGNDACTLDVANALRLNVGAPLKGSRTAVVEIGGGPAGARRVLTALAAASLQESSSYEQIARITRVGRPHPARL